MLFERTGGYDMEKTREYYRAVIQRAKAALLADMDRAGNEQLNDRDMQWLLLDETWDELVSNNDFHYEPEWMEYNPAGEGIGFKDFVLELVGEISRGINNI